MSVYRLLLTVVSLLVSRTLSQKGRPGNSPCSTQLTLNQNDCTAAFKLIKYTNGGRIIPSPDQKNIVTGSGQCKMTIRFTTVITKDELDQTVNKMLKQCKSKAFDTTFQALSGGTVQVFTEIAFNGDPSSPVGGNNKFSEPTCQGGSVVLSDCTVALAKIKQNKKGEFISPANGMPWYTMTSQVGKCYVNLSTIGGSGTSNVIL
ncbi:hypothetical protein PGT21_013740 [Puccinia graminis f. sp. tritici]|uniref:Ubiquitin 3 binding protein But2 C-terminal domain-containing protein n=1 Tax=Puccinia graminis f. sp. tritici TaxID=56615 RepID=A0A5B0QU40_PUCGR|nr:hypothetical protein PGT21_013740 [Puccinia graminis f. sp. tritici]